MITAGKLHVFGIQHHVQPVVYIALVQMKQITKPERFLSIFVALIAEFAATYQIKQKQAFNYLNRFKGLVFLQKHYEVMHTQSFEDSIEALSMVCRRNGGQL